MKTILLLLITILIFPIASFANIDATQSKDIKIIKEKILSQNRVLIRKINSLKSEFNVYRNVQEKKLAKILKEKKNNKIPKSKTEEIDTKINDLVLKLDRIKKDKTMDSEIKKATIKVYDKRISSLKEDKVKLINPNMGKEEVKNNSHFSFNASFVSDYVWRGQTQTSHGPAIQGGMDINFPFGISVGTWVSNITGGAENDVYAGINFPMGELTLNLSYIWYNYIQYPTTNTSEASFSISWENFTASVAYTDDYFASTSSSVYWNFSANFNLPSRLLTSFSIGNTTFNNDVLSGSTDYFDFLFSIGREFDWANISLNYSDTNRKTKTETEKTKTFDQSIFINISKSF